MKRLNILTAMLFFGFVCAVVAWSDIINLKSGGRLEGIIREETDDAITLLLPGGGTAKIKRDMIKSVDKTSSEEQAEKSHKPKKEKEKSEYRSIEQESKTQKYRKEGKAQNKKPKAQKPERPVPEPTGFPDGLVGRRYSLVIAPKDAVPPYKITLLSGNLPPGLIINERIGGIEGEPNQPGEWELELSLVGSKDKKETIKDTLHIWKRLLTVGEDGTFKGFNGMQMALNMAQDFDEIRIQAGTCKGTGLVIPGNKEWEHGIKISGGWDEDFLNRKGETILDGGKRENSILTIFNEKGEVHIEDLTFTNSKGRAVNVEAVGLFTSCNEEIFFTNCKFINNSDSSWGGAISGKGTFVDCIFANNSSGKGGAVYGGGSFKNCIFNNNKAIGSSPAGGAVFIRVRGKGEFTNCIFVNNSAYKSAYKSFGSAYGTGGAVSGGDYANLFMTNCTFNNNFAGSAGGAVLNRGNSCALINCIFTGNSAKKGGGFYSLLHHSEPVFSGCLFYKNLASLEGGAYYNNAYGSKTKIANCTFGLNEAKEKGGAIRCEKTSGQLQISNSIFYKNIEGGNNNDISADGSLDIDYCLINHLKGAVNFGPHNITGDPKFVDPQNGKFSLRADSPCIDKGTTLEEIKKEVEETIEEIKDEKIRKMAEKSVSSDLAGNQRITGGEIDLGAYEWQGK